MIGVLAQEYAYAESLHSHDAIDSFQSIFNIYFEHFKSKHSGQNVQCNEMEAIKQKGFSNLRLKIENTADMTFKLKDYSHINITAEPDSTLCIEATGDEHNL